MIDDLSLPIYLSIIFVIIVCICVGEDPSV